MYEDASFTYLCIVGVDIPSIMQALFVGSSPYDPAKTFFEKAVTALPTQVKSLPDGETK